MTSNTTTPATHAAKNVNGFPPRVIFFRHGETKWSLSGQHTSITDLPLTENGECRVKSTGKALVGPDRLIDLKNIEKIYCSPRLRARRTLELILENCSHQPEPKPKPVEVSSGLNFKKDATTLPIEYTERIREWDYGLYEGMTTKEIDRWRIKKGLNVKLDSLKESKTESKPAKNVEVTEEEVPKPNPNEDLHEQDYRLWSIWRDGCEGGEFPDDVCVRVDDLIDEIIKIQQRAVAEGRSGDVLVVAHGHILRTFSMRWLSIPLDNDPQIRLILDAGGSGVLSYEHSNWNEKAINLGGAFTVPKEKNL